MKAMKKFLDNLKPQNTFICFTHCDEKKVDQKFIKEKIASLKRYGDLEIPEDNIILFDKTQKSLEEFVANMVPGNIRISKKIDEALDNFDDDM